MDTTTTLNKAQIKNLFDYSARCWQKMEELLRNNAEEFHRPFATTAQWNTVRLILAHTIAAEERWILLRLQGIEIPVGYEKRAAASIEQLCADQRDIRELTLAYLDQLTEEELAEKVPVNLPQWDFQGGLPRADIFFHIINHESHHRGQVIMALQRFGVDPPNFDYVLLYPVKQSPGESGE